MKIRLTDLRDAAAHRPAGYYDECISSGIVDGEYLNLECNVYLELCRKYRRELPPFTRMLANFEESILSWAKSGFAIVSKDEFHRRINLCKACPERIPSIFARCAVCGCFQVKPWIANERCKIGKW